MRRLDNRHILLVHPLGYPAEASSRDISRIANVMPPIGIASIAAYLETRQIKSSIIDCFARPFSDRLIREYLISQRPGFIGLSCTTSSFFDAIRIAKMAKTLLPGIKCVFGGPHVSALTGTLFESYAEMDFSVVGEGEETLADLIESEGIGGSDVRGLVYRDLKGNVHFSGYRTKGMDLDNLPFPAYNKLNGFPSAYSLPIFNYPRTPNTSCISSRGCPYQCSYCDRSVYRKSFRYNSAEYMFAHLRYLKERFGILHINFYDDQFTFNRSRIQLFADMMIRSSLNMTFNCAVRAEHIDIDLLKMMKAAGCWMISLGIETGDQALLARHRQNADLNMLAEKLSLVRKAGIRIKGLLMMGLPGETEASIQKSMRYVASLRLDDFNLSKFTPFPGSPIYDKIRDFGTFEEDWNRMDCMHFLFVPMGMTRERLDFLFKQFYKRHFMMPRVIAGYIAMLWKSTDSWIRFLRNIACFFRFARSNNRGMDLM